MSATALSITIATTEDESLLKAMNAIDLNNAATVLPKIAEFLANFAKASDACVKKLVTTAKFTEMLVVFKAKIIKGDVLTREDLIKYLGDINVLCHKVLSKKAKKPLPKANTAAVAAAASSDNNDPLNETYNLLSKRLRELSANKKLGAKLGGDVKAEKEGRHIILAEEEKVKSILSKLDVNLAMKPFRYSPEERLLYDMKLCIEFFNQAFSPIILSGSKKYLSLLIGYKKLFKDVAGRYESLSNRNSLNNILFTKQQELLKASIDFCKTINSLST